MTKAAFITKTVWLYVTLTLVFATIGSIFSKAMFLQILPTCLGCEAVQFNHPYMQTLFMFFGEFCCIFIWLISESIKKHKKQPEILLKQGKVYFKFIPHTFLFAIPTVFDLIASSLFNLGNYYSDPSVYSILTNISVVFVALLSLCLFKDYRHSFDLPQILGIIIIFLGESIIVLGSILFATSGSVAVNPSLGAIFTILGCFVSSWFFLVEEISLRKIQTIGYMGVANEGGWGLLFCAIALPILNKVEDPLSLTIPKSNFEDIEGWAYQMSISWKEIVFHIFYVVCVLVLNFSGMEVTNHASAATRTTFSSLKPIFVWVIAISIGWEPWDNKSTPTKWAGFIVVTLGVLIFNNVLKLIPFLKTDNIEIHGKWMGKHAHVQQNLEIQDKFAMQEEY